MFTPAAARTFKRWSIAAAGFAAVCFATLGRSEDIGYDSKADPFDQLSAALDRANAEHKPVLLIAGGDWCVWCHYLYEFLERNHDIDASLHDVFVVAKVYVGDENRNEDFFATLPKAAGAPHFWILSRKGELLKSQPTDVLEDGAKSYRRDAFVQFIGNWKGRAQ